MWKLSSVQIARFIVSFSWIYHGVFPKLFHIAPLEKLMTASLGYSEQMSNLITKAAGIGEVVFGILLFIFYRNKPLIILNILALLGLLLFVALLQPQLLIEAFNPVTTNMAIIALSFVLLNNVRHTDK
ncbi:DoxX-like family protein [Pseudoalteromonas fenneropenaei]|uniref:DoxX-like family protein n=1 Tax=Pseudoalteromonas fenneropenaei TaxID=1737459 RepID=A0ABV7CFU9_9GAMM